LWAETSFTISHRELFSQRYIKWENYIPCYSTVRSAWNRLENFLKQHCAHIYDSLRDGATEDEIDDLEMVLNTKLPLSMRLSYRIHNGQHADSSIDTDDPEDILLSSHALHFGIIYGYRLLPLNTIQVLSRFQKMASRDAENHRIVSSRCPFAQALFPIGCTVCVDQDGDRPLARIGQIVMSIGPSRKQSVTIAPSFDQFLHNLATDLEEEKITLIERTIEHGTAVEISGMRKAGVYSVGGITLSISTRFEPSRSSIESRDVGYSNTDKLYHLISGVLSNSSEGLFHVQLPVKFLLMSKQGVQTKHQLNNIANSDMKITSSKSLSFVSIVEALDDNTHVTVVVTLLGKRN
jgi:cell wall assembly regulator SMI1